MMLDNSLEIEILKICPPDALGVLLFGSAARCQLESHSDIDVLILQTKPKSFKVGRINVSAYSPSHLGKLADSGSLFVRHLVDDGRILQDPSGLIGQCMARYSKPSDYHAFWDSLRCASMLLDVSEWTFDRRSRTFIDVAAFILRTAVYLKADEQGVLLFSLEHLHQRTGWQEVKQLRDMKLGSNRCSRKLFQDLSLSISAMLGVPIRNEADTIEAYIVNNYEHEPLVVSLGLRVLSGHSIPTNYDLFSPVILASLV